jgi:dipeptidyl-peptidase 4
MSANTLPPVPSSLKASMACAPAILALAVVITAVIAVTAPGARAQGAREDYDRAVRFLPGNSRATVKTADVDAHWIEKSNRFWYRSRTAAGWQFLLVDADKNTSEPAFDHAQLAQALSKVAGRAIAPEKLPFANFEFVKDGKAIRLTVAGVEYTCELGHDCTGGGGQKYESLSPNGAWAAFVKDHNLYLRYLATGETIALTRDGVAGYDYATELPSLGKMIAQGTEDLRQEPAVFWSPDSSKLATYRIDSRSAGRYTSLQFVPPDQMRPRAYSVVYPLPGEVLPSAEPIIFEVASGKRIDVKTPPLELPFQDGPGFDWFPNSQSVFYDYDERGEKAIELREVNPATGEQKTLIREESAHYVDPGETQYQFAHDAGKIVWTSERDGWNHIYLYDAKTGQLERQLTHGPWVVRRIVSVDEKNRRVYFLANGREKGEDPYLTHLYSVGFDAQGLRLISPEPANHVASVSADGTYFVDSYSRVDLPGKSALRRVADGSEVRALEQADASELQKTGWKFPEPFQGKATDGATDLYGVIWRPSNFDPSKKYPVVEQVYTGPQDFFVPKTFAAAVRGGEQSVAELGFIVVMIDGRGTTGRSRAFHEFSYRNLGGSFEDHVAMIRQMAEKFPYIDATRVGIYGTSAGGYGSAHAMLVFPDFYKVCVSISGDHDARLDKAWWNELYQGYPVGEDYNAQSNVTMAGRLAGHLLLVHGDVDDNVHPVETMRFADALMKANKNFDMLFVPNMYHGEGGNPYLVRRRWDYFVKYLLGVEPPPNFEIHEQQEPDFVRGGR